jgi:hypothetical protein
MVGALGFHKGRVSKADPSKVTKHTIRTAIHTDARRPLIILESISGTLMICWTHKGTSYAIQMPRQRPLGLKSPALDHYQASMVQDRVP